MDAPTTPTPAATIETSPAAPATSAPPPSVAPAERPTMAQAFAADAALHPDDASTEQDQPTTPAVETPPADSALHPGTKEGPIPFAVHKTALENARVKAGEEAVAQYRQQYGWAESVPKETLQEWSGIASLMTSDPPAFLDKFFSEAAAHPTHGAAVRSWAARTLASRAPKAVDLSPDVTVQDDQGREVARTFSADRVQAIVQHAVQEAIGKEVAPLKQERDQRKAEEQRHAETQRAEQTKQQLETHADSILADIAEILDVTADTPADQAKALYDEIEALLTAHPQLTAHKAAMQVRKTRIVPRLQGQAQTKVLDDLKTKAAAQGLNPAGAVVAPAHRPTSLLDPSLSWE